MRSIVYLSGLGLGLLLWVGCAPVDEAALEEASTEAPQRQERPPTPVPGGVRQRIEAALQNVRQRDLLTTHGFWTVFHGILGLGPDTTLLDQLTGRRVKALEYICKGRAVRGLEFFATPHGLDVRTGPQFVGQGHQDQYIAEMAQWGLPAETRFVVQGKEYTFAEFIRHTQMRASVKSGQELSWAILVIGQYLGTDLRWTNAAGEKLRFEDVVKYEVNEPVDSAACGGTHRLFGLTWVYHLHLARGGRKTGVWRQVEAHTGEYMRRARKFQHGDGSFSTRYLAGPGNGTDPQLRIGTTGHVLEWLALALPDEELRAGWMQQAASALALMILDIQGRPMEGGALYHATHGLQIYRDRVFGRPKEEGKGPMIPQPPR
jgi:hypothetical protein